MLDTKASGSEPLSVVRTQEELREQLTRAGLWKVPPYTTFPAHWLTGGEQRLDASHYTNEAFTALHIVRDCGYAVEHLDQLVTELTYPGRFKRIYAKTEDDGVPFLTASTMLHFRPKSNLFLAKHYVSLYDCLVNPGTMLVTRSGTVGRCVIVGHRLSHFAFSDDAIRIQTREIPVGYLYGYLSSRFGQALLTKDQYGSAIKHLEPHHIAGVPVPLLPEKEQIAIHNDIMRAYALREEANKLLDEADELLYSELGLPHFDNSLVPYLPIPKQQPAKYLELEMPHPRAFTIKASEFDERLDASYHIPVARTVTSLLRKGRYSPVRLGQLAEKIFIPYRFKRIYVSKGCGAPFLLPSQILYFKLWEQKYLSNLANAQDIENCRLQSGWLILTRSGTVGRAMYITKYFDGWIGSDDLVRVVVEPTKVQSGYLYAFLDSPYGRLQMESFMYGAVIKHLEEHHIKDVWVPNVPLNVQETIGQRVVSAFLKKDEAANIEEAVIKRVEDALEKGKENVL
jgi:type I restriction enzyme S subunit